MDKINKTITIVGNGVRLRKLSINDLQMLHNNCSSDKEVAQYCAWSPSKNILETKKILDKWISKYNEEYTYIWGIEIIDTGELIGTISVVEKNIDKKICEIGYAIGKKWWNVGYATRCLSYIINFLFGYTIFETIICKAIKFNVPSIKVMQKNGMTLTYDKYPNIEDKSQTNVNELVTYQISKSDYKRFNNYDCFLNLYDFNDFNNFYDMIYKKYKNKVDTLNKKLLFIIKANKNIEKNISKYINLNIQRKKILCEVIKECIGFFDIISKNDVIVYLTGSYSRNNQRLYSDIDINYIYDDKIFSKMIVVEELIAYILTIIFDISYRDRVHAMGYIALTKNYKLNDSNNYIVKFSSGDIVINECRKNSIDIMYENINMPRNIECIIKYIESSNKINLLNEFVYNHEIIYSKHNSDCILENIHKEDLKIINNQAFPYYYKLFTEKICDDILYQASILNNKVNYIREFKKKYKTTPLNTISKMFMLIRRREMYKDKNTNIELIKIDFDILNKYIDSESVKGLELNYYEYIFELNRIENVFSLSKVSLSSHTDMDMSKVSKMYKKIYNNSIDDNISKKLKKLYYNIIDILEILNEGVKQ